MLLISSEDLWPEEPCVADVPLTLKGKTVSTRQGNHILIDLLGKKILSLWDCNSYCFLHDQLVSGCSIQFKPLVCQCNTNKVLNHYA